METILLPKIVQSGGGYKAMVDIVNVDTITCNSLVTGGTGLQIDSNLDLNGHLLTNTLGNVALGTALDLNGHVLTDATGDVSLGKNINLEGHSIYNGTATLTTVDATTLTHAGGVVSLGTYLDLQNNIIQNAVGSGDNLIRLFGNVQVGGTTSLGVNNTGDIYLEGRITSNRAYVNMGCILDMAGYALNHMPTLNGVAPGAIQQFSYTQNGANGGSASTFHSAFATYPLNSANPSLTSGVSSKVNGVFSVSGVSTSTINGITIPTLLANQFVLYGFASNTISSTAGTSFFLQASIPCNAGTFQCVLGSYASGNTGTFNILAYGSVSAPGGTSTLTATIPVANGVCSPVYEVRLRTNAVSGYAATDLGTSLNYGTNSDVYGTLLVTQLPTN
jgi:hypothetical protein